VRKLSRLAVCRSAEYTPKVHAAKVRGLLTAGLKITCPRLWGVRGGNAGQIKKGANSSGELTRKREANRRRRAGRSCPCNVSGIVSG